jgi:hypothetical protein
MCPVPDVSSENRMFLSRNHGLIQACEAVNALIVANHFLETDLEKLKAAVSMVLCASVQAAGFQNRI